METEALRRFQPVCDHTVPDAIRSFIDDVVSVRSPTGPDRTDGDHGSNGLGCDVSDDSGGSASGVWGSVPAQLLFDVFIPGDVVPAGAVLSELVRGFAVHFVLVDDVVFRDWYVARVGVEGVLDCVVRCGVHDAVVPVGVHLHAVDEHEVVSVVVGVYESDK